MATSLEPRPNSEALQHTLTRLAGATGGAGLVWLASWLVLAPPEGTSGRWPTIAALAAVLTLPCAFAAVRPESRGARWLPSIATGMAFVALAWTHVDSGLVGWWRTTELAALLALVATVAVPIIPALLIEAGILAGVAVVLFQSTVEGTVGAGTVVMASAGVRLLVAATAVWLANVLLLDATRRTDALVRLESAQRELLATEERSRRTDRAARRFLHDSGMNSLEAISRGLPDEAVASLRERCALDAERWLAATSAAADDTESAFQPALAEAAMRGLQVDQQFAVEGRLPDGPLEALVAASAESLRNVAKHAGVNSASLSVEVTGGQALVVIADEGRGFGVDPGGAGMGIEESIHRRLAEVGGSAEVSSHPEVGTQVVLRWPDVDSAGQTPDAPGAVLMGLPEAAVKVAWVAVGLTAIGAAMTSAVNWWSVQSPLLLLLTALGLAGTGAWLLLRWQRGLTDPFDVGLAAVAVSLSTLALPVADPFCSAASGSPLLPDGRLLIVVIIGVLLASWRASLTVLSFTLAALLGAAFFWQILWPMCVPQMLPNAVGLVLVTLASVVLGRTLRLQQQAAADAFAAAEAATLEVARQRADDLVRQQWSTATVSEARELLRRVADETTAVDDPAIRKQAGDIAARLRAVVRAREFPGDLGTAFTAMVEAGRVSGFPVTIEGDLSDPLDPATASAIASAMTRWWEPRSASCRDARLTLSTFAGVSSVLVEFTQTGAAGDDAIGVVTASAPPESPAELVLDIESWSEGPRSWWRAAWPSSSNLLAKSAVRQ